MPHAYLASAYWPGDGLEGQPPPAAAGGYPAWQSTVLRGLVWAVVLVQGFG